MPIEQVQVHNHCKKDVTIQQGVQGDCVPLPEREVSSLHLLFSRALPQAARIGYLNRSHRICQALPKRDGEAIGQERTLKP